VKTTTNYYVLQHVQVTLSERHVSELATVTPQMLSTPPRRVMRPQGCASVTSTGWEPRVTRILTSAPPGRTHVALTRCA